MQRWLNQFHRSRFHLPKIPSRKENRPLAIIRRWGTMKEWHEDKRDRPATEGETLYRIRVDYPLFENEPQRAQSSPRREQEEIKVKRGYICGFGITHRFEESRFCSREKVSSSCKTGFDMTEADND